MMSTSGHLLRKNALGIHLLPEHMYRVLFGEASTTSPCADHVELSLQHLKEQGIDNVVTANLDDMWLPKLCGNNISEHFWRISKSQIQDYRSLIDTLISGRIPPVPDRWLYSPGWTKYNYTTDEVEQVDYPREDTMVLDVEVCTKLGHTPVIATLLSPTSWYSWVSDRLFHEKDYPVHDATPTDLIPMGHTPLNSKRLVVGHHVSYDRARILEEYNVANSGMRFLDTLSLHVCVSGQTTLQKGLWRKKHKKDSSDREQSSTRLTGGKKTSWLSVSCPNSLENVYELYCEEKMDKSLKDIFVKGTMKDVRDNFQDLMSYCSQDVKCTKEVLTKLYPLYSERCPHPASLAGLLELSSVYLPVNQSWKTYIESANYVAEELENELTMKLMEVAENVSSFDNINDVWLSNLNWDYKKLRKKGKTSKKMAKQIDEISGSDPTNEAFLVSSLSSKKETVHLPGYPEWYRSLCERRSAYPWRPGPTGISPQMRISPYLLKMKWDDKPLYHHSSKGWGYLIPADNGRTLDIWNANNVEQWTFELDNITDEFTDLITDNNILSDNDDILSGAVPKLNTKAIVTINGNLYYFIKLPHKNGPTANCGNPLSKDYMGRMEDGLLTSEAGADGQRILHINTMISSWRGNKKRIEDQFVVWFNEGINGAILPQLMPVGTATRRAVEKTWLTASNAKEFRVGSELKAMVQAPNGYSIVGADVDSQELWIASLLGDSHFTGSHGCTALSWMTLCGDKSCGTDLHSKTASTIGISREQAKIFNYGRMYGAGKKFAKLLLKQFNPSLSDSEIEDKANSLYKVTKGDRRVILSKKMQGKVHEHGGEVWSDGSVDQSLVYQLFTKRELQGGIRGRYWNGGTESYMFNKLEMVANSKEPVTPVLKCRMSRALEPKHVGTDFQPSRVNWVVQSSAVDYLHLMLVSMRWFMDRYNIRGRLCITIHDEVRYLVDSRDKYRAALALQLSNLFTRAMFAYEIGIPDLPMSVAFFSSVDIDQVLRKEVNLDCKTPSNPLGLRQGYNIPYGEAIDIIQLLKKIEKL